MIPKRQDTVIVIVHSRSIKTLHTKVAKMENDNCTGASNQVTNSKTANLIALLLVIFFAFSSSACSATKKEIILTENQTKALDCIIRNMDLWKDAPGKNSALPEKYNITNCVCVWGTDEHTMLTYGYNDFKNETGTGVSAGPVTNLGWHSFRTLSVDLKNNKLESTSTSTTIEFYCVLHGKKIDLKSSSETAIRSLLEESYKEYLLDNQKKK